MRIVTIKRRCVDAGIEKVDAGPKGAVVSFHRDTFAQPEGLIAFIQKRANTVKLRPDHKLVFQQNWEDPATRARGVKRLIDDLAGLAGDGAIAV